MNKTMLAMPGIAALTGSDGKYYLFGYLEYTGNNCAGDVKKLAAELRNQQWLSVTSPMRPPLPGDKSWAMMEEAYHNP
jgi:L-rhamnose mutarotase